MSVTKASGEQQFQHQFKFKLLETPFSQNKDLSLKSHIAYLILEMVSELGCLPL